jgi:uncharacterized protein YhfF
MSELTGIQPDDDAVAAFWETAKRRAKMTSIPGYFGPSPVESVPPPAWSFGANPEQADELLALVLDGTKTATTSALADYESEDEPLPEIGTLGIVLDGSGTPRALVVTTEVRVVPFDQVDEEHARREGEGDRSLAGWRARHQEFFTDHSAVAFSSDMPVVLERLEVLYEE